jgi:hypothetical protein
VKENKDSHSTWKRGDILLGDYGIFKLVIILHACIEAGPLYEGMQYIKWMIECVACEKEPVLTPDFMYPTTFHQLYYITNIIQTKN